MGTSDCRLESIKHFQRIFTGSTKAYGVHEYAFSNNGKKEAGKSYTVKNPITEQVYTNHLNGKTGLGIIPIINNSCKFMAIDIDVYDKSLNYIVDIIYNYHLPLVPFRTKSGGLHLYVFFKELTRVVKAIKVINSIVMLFGLNKKTEVFPKQQSLTEGQLGNWINLPYFDCSQTKQYLINKEYQGLSLDEAITVIYNRECSLDDLKYAIEDMPLSDAPPCVQTIYLSKNTDYRSNYLFAVGTYLKAKDPDGYKNKLLEINSALQNPLDENEVESTILKSHSRRDYKYTCNESPLCDHCNKSLCNKRPYGIRSSGIANLDYGELVQYMSDPPHYEWVINKKKLLFYSESELLKQDRFRELCMRKIGIVIGKLKEETWHRILSRAFNNLIVRQVDFHSDVSPGALLRKHLITFLHRKSRSKDVGIDGHKQLLNGGVVFDYENNRFLFRVKDFTEYVINEKLFKYYSTTRIYTKIRDVGCHSTKVYMHIDGTRESKKLQVRCWAAKKETLLQYIEEEDKLLDAIEDRNIDFKSEYAEEPY